MAKLTFYRMSEDAIKEEKDAAANKSSSVASPYMNQTLQLSKHFGPWS